MIRSVTIAFLGLLVFGCSRGAAQTSDETRARVPELDAFHVTIATIWHTAWPARDIPMLLSLRGDVEKGTASVAGAQLPGILREKETAWKQGVATLQDRARSYAAAADAADSAALLSAAERLHSQYEALVRIIRPVLKEVGAFHEVLYVLYHYHVPAFAMDSIAAVTPVLTERMAALNAAVLPARLQTKQEAFATSRAALSEKVTAFAVAVRTRDRAPISAAMDSLHTAYQSLEAVFK